MFCMSLPHLAARSKINSFAFFWTHNSFAHNWWAALHLAPSSGSHWSHIWRDVLPRGPEQCAPSFSADRDHALVHRMSMACLHRCYHICCHHFGQENRISLWSSVNEQLCLPNSWEWQPGTKEVFSVTTANLIFWFFKSEVFVAHTFFQDLWCIF